MPMGLNGRQNRKLIRCRIKGCQTVTELQNMDEFGKSKYAGLKLMGLNKLQLCRCVTNRKFVINKLLGLSLKRLQDNHFLYELFGRTDPENLLSLR